MRSIKPRKNHNIYIPTGLPNISASQNPQSDLSRVAVWIEAGSGSAAIHAMYN